MVLKCASARALPPPLAQPLSHLAVQDNALPVLRPAHLPRAGRAVRAEGRDGAQPQRSPSTSSRSSPLTASRAGLALPERQDPAHVSPEAEARQPVVDGHLPPPAQEGSSGRGHQAQAAQPERAPPARHRGRLHGGALRRRATPSSGWRRSPGPAAPQPLRDTSAVARGQRWRHSWRRAAARGLHTAQLLSSARRSAGRQPGLPAAQRARSGRLAAGWDDTARVRDGTVQLAHASLRVQRMRLLSALTLSRCCRRSRRSARSARTSARRRASWRFGAFGGGIGVRGRSSSRECLPRIA